jgi:hypothetical protein
MHHANELLEHLLGDGEVGNHAVFHGANGFNVARHLAQHGFGFVTNRLQDFFALGAAFMANGHDGGLVENNAFVAHKNQGVGGA